MANNMLPWKIIQKLESDNSRLFKEDVIENHLNDIEIQDGLAMCLDSLVTFGVKQVPDSSQDGPGLSWVNFKRNAILLINRDKTGHAARDLIIELMHEATSEQWNDWYRRILIKDLRCGVSEKTGTLNLIPILFATLFTVFSLTPHLRSLISILLYQLFH